MTISAAAAAKPIEQPSLTVIMPTIDWGATFQRCVQAVVAGLRDGDDFVVVLDGPPIPSPDWLLSAATLVVHTGMRSGPAAARNQAAREARSELLMFVDADVELHPDSIQRVRRHFALNPRLDAVFGSYDNKPAAKGLVSKFRNLLHHYTHQINAGPAATFWAGCGAVSRGRFLSLGGFDAETYRLPCIEDIEFGVRLSGADGFILLDPTIQCTHHKRWTLISMLRTDILQRAVPWSRLILSGRELPATLNLTVESRVSGILSLVAASLAILFMVSNFRPLLLVFAIVCFGLILFLNRLFILLLWQRGGASLACVGAPLLWLYYFYSAVVFGVVAFVESSRKLVSKRSDAISRET